MNNWRKLEDTVELLADVTPDEQLKHQFIERTKKHIELVNYFGAKIDRVYPAHDSSKLDFLLDYYCYFCKLEKTPDEEKLLDIATLVHITNAPHHVEYWTSTDLTGFTRANPNPSGIIDASEMPEESLEEMVCDWCAVSKEKGNTPFEWFRKVNGVRWLFTPEQQSFIRRVSREIWD